MTDKAAPPPSPAPACCAHCSRRALLVPRVLLGVLFLVAAWGKWNPDQGPSWWSAAAEGETLPLARVLGEFWPAKWAPGSYWGQAVEPPPTPEGDAPEAPPAADKPDYPLRWYTSLLEKGLGGLPPGPVPEGTPAEQVQTRDSRLLLLQRCVLLGETLMGVALLTGTLVRLAGVLGMFMNLNFLLGSAAAITSASGWNGYLFLAVELALVWGAAGRTLGVDAYLARSRLMRLFS